MCVSKEETKNSEKQLISEFIAYLKNSKHIIPTEPIIFSTEWLNVPIDGRDPATKPFGYCFTTKGVRFKVHGGNEMSDIWLYPPHLALPTELTNAINLELKREQQRAISDILSKALKDLHNAHINHGFLQRKQLSADNLKIIPAGVSIPVPAEHAHLFAERQNIIDPFPFDRLVIPKRDINNKIWNFELINPNKNSTGNDKFPVKGALSKGLFYSCGKWSASNLQGVIYLAESWADAASVHSVSGKTVVCCFGTENIEFVLLELKKKFKDHKFVLLANNDALKCIETRKNPGIEIAKHLAEKYGMQYIVPTIEGKGAAANIDWSDVYLYDKNLIAEYLKKFNANPVDTIQPSTFSVKVDPDNFNENFNLYKHLEHTDDLARNGHLIEAIRAFNSTNHTENVSGSSNFFWFKDKLYFGRLRLLVSNDAHKFLDLFSRQTDNTHKIGFVKAFGSSIDINRALRPSEIGSYLNDPLVKMYVYYLDVDFVTDVKFIPIAKIICPRNGNGCIFEVNGIKRYFFGNFVSKRNEHIQALLGVYGKTVGGYAKYFYSCFKSADVPVLELTERQGLLKDNNYVFYNEHSNEVISNGSYITPEFFRNYTDEILNLAKPNLNIIAWQNNIARYAVGNDYMLLALSMAATASVWSLLQKHGNGFTIHFWGDSQQAKTLLMLFASSFYGSTSEGHIGSWNQTAFAFEDYLYKHKDRLVALDEFHMVSKVEFSNILYNVRGNKSRSRGNKDGGVNAIKPHSTLNISTGETNIEGLLHQHKLNEKQKGITTLFSEITVCYKTSTDFAVVRNLHDKADAETFCRELSEQIANSNSNPVFDFVQKFTTDKNSLPWVTDKVQKIRDYFNSKNIVVHSQHKKAFNFYALIAACGEYAIKCGVFPFKKGDCLLAVLNSFLQTQQSNSSVLSREELEFFNTLNDMIEFQKTRFSYRNPKSQVDKKACSNPLGYVDTNNDDGQWHLIHFIKNAPDNRYLFTRPRMELLQKCEILSKGDEGVYEPYSDLELRDGRQIRCAGTAPRVVTLDFFKLLAFIKKNSTNGSTQKIEGDIMSFLFGDDDFEPAPPSNKLIPQDITNNETTTEQELTANQQLSFDFTFNNIDAKSISTPEIVVEKYRVFSIHLKDTRYSVSYVKNSNDVAHAFTLATSGKFCGIDIETTASLETLKGLNTQSTKKAYRKALRNAGLKPQTGEIRLIQLCNPDTKQVYIFDCFDSQVLEQLKPLLTKLPPRFLVAHNATFETSYLAHNDINVDIECTFIAQKLTYFYDFPADCGSLQFACKQHLGIDLDKSLQASDWSREHLTPEQLKYAAIDSAVVTLLWSILQEKLQTLNNKDFIGETLYPIDLYQLNQQMIKPVVAMQLTGMSFDAVEHARLVEQWTAEKATHAIALLATLPPVESKKQPLANDHIAAWLTSVLSKATLKIIKTTDSGGRICVDEKALRKICSMEQNDEVITIIKEHLIPYIKTKSLLDKFGEEFRLQYLTHNRVFASFNILQAITGRMSSTNPNLQNIPKRGQGAVCRTLFTASDGCKLVKADLAQIELVTFAYLTNNRTMIECLEQGVDLHRKTAAVLKNKLPEEVTAEERTLAKAVNFGLLFGMQPAAFVENTLKNYNIELTLEEATEYREKWLDTYPGIRETHYQWLRYVQENRVIRTACGKTRQWRDSEHYLNECLNHPIQGTAAEMLKLAVVDAYSKLEALKAVIVNLVHDEIVVDSPIENVNAVALILASSFRKAFHQLIPQAPEHIVNRCMEVCVGDNWASSEKLNIPNECFISSNVKHVFDYSQANSADGFKRKAFVSGKCEYVIKKASNQISKKGNAMSVLEIEVKDEHQSVRKVKKYIVHKGNYLKDLERVVKSVQNKRIDISNLNIKDFVGAIGDCEVEFQASSYGLEPCIYCFNPVSNQENISSN